MTVPVKKTSVSLRQAAAVDVLCKMEGITKLKWFLFLLLTVAVIFPKTTTAEETQLTKLYLLTILPYPDPTATIPPAWDAGPNLLPAAELAVELINNRTDILEGYQLELIHDDGGCNVVVKTVTSFVRQILVQQNHQPVIGVIGGGCSDSTLTLSPLFARESISLINMHLGGSPRLENRILYPNTFGAAGSIHGIVATIFALMNSNNWKQIAVLYDESSAAKVSMFLELAHNIERAVPGGNIIFSSAVYTTEFPLAALKGSHARIIVAATPPELVRRMMCLGYHEGILFPVFQWILVLRTLEFFTAKDTVFYYDGERYTCSSELMSKMVLRGNLLLIYRLSAIDPGFTTVAGISYDEYLSIYEDRINQYSNPIQPLSPSVWASVVFDEVWALALALNNSNVDLSEYRVGQYKMTSVIRNEVYKLDFEGVSGHIKFDNATGFSPRDVRVFQVIAAHQEEVASYNGRSIVNFGNGTFISDMFQTSVATVPIQAIGVCTAVSLILLSLIVAAHVATIKYRKHSEIKATSPALNQLIYIGCYIFIAGTLLYNLYEAIPLNEEKAGNMCHAVWVWFIPFGYILITGTIIARTWRLYRIFTHTFNPGCLISTPLLFIFVCLLLSVGIINAVLWSFIDPLKMVVVSASVVKKETGYEIVQRRLCISSYIFWAAIATVYYTCIMVAMIAVSLLTLKITKKNFTTKALRVLSYLLGLVVVICSSVYGITFGEDMHIFVPYIVLSFMLNSIIFLCFSLVFLPQILALLKTRFRLIRVLFDHFDKS